MSKFEDAKRLIIYCEESFEQICNQHKECLLEQEIKPCFLIKIKNFIENLHSALDYCAAGLFIKYGVSKKSSSKKINIYFPYARIDNNREKYQNMIIERSIPGLLKARPDIVKRLESYQHFGNTGNWLPIFMDIVNKNKHEQLTPQIKKEYTMVHISGTLPPGGSVEIDLKNITLGGGPDKPFNAVAGKWTGLEFTYNGVLVIPFLDYVLQNINKIVNELSNL